MHISEIPLESFPSFQSYLSPPCEKSIFLEDCTSAEIISIICEFNNGTASDIPIVLVKKAAYIIAPHLESLYNRCISTGNFPDILKVGKVTPIYKKDNRENIENYRPISTLPIFGKIFEKIIYSRLEKCDFVSESGRSVAAFGETYKYNGSRNETIELPNPIKTLLDQLNIDQQHKLNSCVVNKYDGPESFIPLHADNERCIDPQSKIFTVSLGEKRLVKFVNTHNGDELSHEANHRSMYSMSRTSQLPGGV